MDAPHRARYLREVLRHIRGHQDVLFCTGEQIHDWYVGQVPVWGQVPA